MLDRLPPELLSPIFRLAVFSYGPDTHGERQRTLKSLCLVCKRARDVAQPMLKEVLAVKFEQGKDSLLKKRLEDGRTYGDVVKVLYLKWMGSGRPPLPEEVAKCVHLTDLALTLRRLVLSDCTITGINLKSLVFPSLFELSICHVRLHKKEAAFFNPRIFPKLRALGFFDLKDQYPSLSTWPSNPPILNLQMQDAARYYRDQLSAPNSNMVVSIYLPLLHVHCFGAPFNSIFNSCPLPFAPAHLRLFDVSFKVRDTERDSTPSMVENKKTTPVEDLALFLALLRRRVGDHPTLRLLILSRQFLDKQYKPANDQLVKQCEAWRVKVLWEDEVASSSEEHRSLVSPAFLHYKGVY
ncbi:hypothetical protein JCM6882_009125 [Rhodosporidiobolus microsporus]